MESHESVLSDLILDMDTKAVNILAHFFSRRPNLYKDVYKQIKICKKQRIDHHNNAELMSIIYSNYLNEDGDTIAEIVNFNYYDNRYTWDVYIELPDNPNRPTEGTTRDLDVAEYKVESFLRKAGWTILDEEENE